MADMTARFISLFLHTSVRRLVMLWLPYRLLSYTFQPLPKPSNIRFRVMPDCNCLPWLLASLTRIEPQRSSFFAFIMVKQVETIVSLRKKVQKDSNGTICSCDLHRLARMSPVRFIRKRWISKPVFGAAIRLKILAYSTYYVE